MKQLKHLDAHQHFWRYDPAQYPWIKPGSVLARDFLPDHLKILLEQSGFDRCIAVQARQTLEETRWLLQLARAHPFIAGVVGWVDLRSKEAAAQLASLTDPKFVGVRHVVQDEPDDRFLLRDDFQAGIQALHSFGLAYDLLLYPKQLPAAIELVRRFPLQTFVLDHMAKPLVRDQIIEPWREQIQELARAGNVSCKISGLVTEAAWQTWRKEDFRPYLETVWKAFGEDRLMLGSDWPVCLLSADYPRTTGLALDFLSELPPAAREKISHRNAARLYRLGP